VSDQILFVEIFSVSFVAVLAGCVYGFADAIDLIYSHLLSKKPTA